MQGINVVIPMAGRGSRFQQFYNVPKPLIPINNEPMISLVTKNLLEHCKQNINLIYICLKEHYEQFDLKQVIEKALKKNNLNVNLNIVKIDGVTEGAACTVLLAKDKINLDDSLMIANSDQFLQSPVMNDWHSVISKYENDGEIMTFKANETKWSYVRLDDNEKVVEVAEKKVISDHATTGIYWWKKAEDFIVSAELTIKKQIKHNNEYYVAPTYNEMIAVGKKIGIVEINKKHMHGLGTPEDLDIFLSRS